MKKLLLLVIILAGCAKEEAVIQSSNSYSYMRRISQEEQEERWKKDQENTAKFVALKIHEGQKFYLTIPKIEDVNCLEGNVTEFNLDLPVRIHDTSFSLSLKHDNVWDKAKIDKATNILESLVTEKCKFYIEIQTNEAGIHSYYNSYDNIIHLNGKILVEYNGQTKSLKEIYIEQDIIDNIIGNIFNDTKGEIYP
jgi:hypothetical protein